MSVFTLVEGKVVINHEAVDMTGTANNVGTGGQVIELDLKGASAGELQSVVAMKTGGSASAFTLGIYDNSSLDVTSLIFEASQDSVSTPRIMCNGEGLAFSSPVTKKIYAKVIPATGAGHTFFVRIQATINRLKV